jgi:hypothetical protein
VRYVTDIAPVVREYGRYKDIKALLREVEGAPLQPPK